MLASPWSRLHLIAESVTHAGLYLEENLPQSSVCHTCLASSWNRTYLKWSLPHMLVSSWNRTYLIAVSATHAGLSLEQNLPHSRVCHTCWPLPGIEPTLIAESAHMLGSPWSRTYLIADVCQNMLASPWKRTYLIAESATHAGLSLEQNLPHSRVCHTCWPLPGREPTS